MGSRYLTDLVAVVRGVGLVCEEEAGWQSRSRGSGGYSGGLPSCVMIHHTASGPSSDGQPDVDYMCYRADARPIANLYLSRSGKVWVMAAGATNTNGSGGPLGPVPSDSMNSSAIGIEAGNDGVGEPWPKAQQDAYIVLVDALCAHYDIPPGHVYSHAEWAPGRKVDPAGPSRWAPAGTWNEDAFRAELAGTATGIEEPVTDEEIQKITANVTAAVLAELPNAIWDTVLGPAYGVGPAPAKQWVTDTRVVAGQIIEAVNPAADPVTTEEP